MRHTINFDSHGGSPVADITADAGTAIPEPAIPARIGYAFQGWFSAETGGTLYVWPHTLVGNLTMHAQWQDNSQPQPTRHTISFDSQGGSAVAALTADEGAALAKPADPTRAGFVFTGWYSAASGGTLYAWPHSVTGSLTMYAQWTAIDYAIAYHLNGGINARENPEGYTVDNPAINLAAATRAGYDFGGWYDNSDLAGTAVVTIPA
jgi:uncharacterized repeat protein (TIGR02543 family)